MSANRAGHAIAFVGAGQLASALAPALHRAGYAVVAVASRDARKAAALAEQIPGCHSTRPERAAEAADLIFLTVPDDAIADVAAGIAWRPGTVAVHCSGAAGLDVLQAAAEQGAETGSFHPLQTFAAGVETRLQGVTVALEGTPRAFELLEPMAAALGCKPLRLPDAAKPLYHASAAFASNYLVALLAAAARLWQPFGHGEREALEALLPLVKTTVSNIERVGTAAAITGPIARGDSGTVRRHITALAQQAPELASLYRELGWQTFRLVHLEPAGAAELESILSDPKETSSCV